jgi:alpha-glucosidase
MLENLGLSGFAFSGADVGGYAGTPSLELLTKWFEVAAFQPIDRDHTEKGTGDQEPWAGGAEQEAIRRRFIETRYRLMPYLYTLADVASRTGLPMVRPLFLEFPDVSPDGHPIDTDLDAAAEFLLGPDLLIAPQPYPEELDTYSVELPSSGWYNYWTGEKISPPNPAVAPVPDPMAVPNRDGKFSIPVTPELAQLPVFVRAGSILPIAPLVQSTNETPQGPLTLLVYVGDKCTGELYLDDGKTYAFQHGSYLRMKFDCQRTAEGVHLNIGPHEGSYPGWWKEIHFEIFGFTPVQDEIVVNSKKVPVMMDRERPRIGFQIADDGKGFDVELK